MASEFSFAKFDGTSLEPIFSISGILPGTYSVSLIDVDRRCWSELTKQISVSADVKDIIFKQTGFAIQVGPRL